MRLRTIRLALVLASLLAPMIASRGLAAQEIPSLHAGQWAAEFTGGNWSNAGVMRFFTPRSALVLSASGSLNRNSETPDGGSKSTNNGHSILLALGLRRHTTVASRVVATTEFGASVASYGSTTRTDGLGSQVLNRQVQTNYGIYGEVGGQYFVASHLALGTVATVNALASSGRIEGGGTATHFHGFSLSTALRPIRVTLYF